MPTGFTTILKGESVNKKEIFIKRLMEVEERHIDWFKKRPALFDYHTHDSIKNHTFNEEDGNLFRLNFWKHCELPEKIKNECVQAFKEVFGAAGLLA